MSAQVIEVLVPSAVQVVEVNPGVPGPSGPAGTGVADVSVSANVIAKGGAEIGELIDSSLSDDGATVTSSVQLQVTGGAAPWSAITLNSYGGGDSRVYGGQVATLFGYVGSAYYYNSSYWRTGNTAASGAKFNQDGSLELFTDGSLTAGANYAPTVRMRIEPTGSIGVPGTIVAAAVNSTGAVTSNGGGIGYAAGAGGSVSQATDKSTGVALDTLCGTITMDAAALSNATTVSFTLTNSFISATDFVMVQHSSGGTLGAYNFAVTPGAGSAVISVRNVHTGSLSEAVVIRFAVFKAVVA